jgi:hypothetical protein
MTERNFEELNLWQRIFAEHWEAFAEYYGREYGQPAPKHWDENVQKILSCGDISEGYYEYYCGKCGTAKKIKVGMMGILQLHGRAGNQNPHLHFNNWRA